MSKKTVGTKRKSSVSINIPPISSFFQRKQKTSDERDQVVEQWAANATAAIAATTSAASTNVSIPPAGLMKQDSVKTFDLSLEKTVLVVASDNDKQTTLKSTSSSSSATPPVVKQGSAANSFILSRPSYSAASSSSSTSQLTFLTRQGSVSSSAGLSKAEIKKQHNKEFKKKIKQEKLDEQEHKNDEWQELLSKSNRDTIFNEGSSGMIPYTWLCPPWPDQTKSNENGMELYINNIDFVQMPAFLVPRNMLETQVSAHKKERFRSEADDWMRDDEEDARMRDNDFEDDDQASDFQVFVPRLFAVSPNGCPTVIRVHGYFEEMFVLVPPQMAVGILRSVFQGEQTSTCFYHEQKRMPCLRLPPFSEDEMKMESWQDQTAFERTKNRQDIRNERDASLFRCPEAKSICNRLHRLLEQYVQRIPDFRARVGNGKFALVRDIRMVLRQNIRGYDGDQQLLMFKIQLSFPDLIRDCMNFFSKGTGISLNGSTYHFGDSDFFDVDIDSKVNFMAKTNLCGSMWCTLPQFKYSMKKNQIPIERNSTERGRIAWEDPSLSFEIPSGNVCTHETYKDGEDKMNSLYRGSKQEAFNTWYRREFDVHVRDIVSHRGKTEEQFSILPCMRNLSIDIEAYRDPKSEANPMNKECCIYSISWVLEGLTKDPKDVITAVSYWQPSERKFAHELTTLEYENGQKRASLWSFETEREFLKDFVDRIRNMGVVKLLGHEIEKYDIPMLLTRCMYHKIYNAPYLSPISEPTDLEFTFFESRGRGQRENAQANIKGIDILDTMVWVLNEEKFVYNSLEALAEEILKVQRSMVSFAKTKEQYDGPPQQFLRFLRHNLQASLIVHGINVSKKLLSYFYPQIAQVSTVTIPMLLYDGVAVRTECRNVAWKNQFGMLHPKAPRSSEKAIEDNYEGGAVEEPQQGIHDDVFTLDFASLYPSIMMALNTCLSTLIDTPEGVQAVPSSYYRKVTIPARYDEKRKIHFPEKNYYFIKMHVRRGIIPVQVIEPYKLRNILKEIIAGVVPYSPMYYSLETQSKALKLQQNGTYGWIAQGARKCIPVPETVCFMGRCFIDTTGKMIVEYFSPKHGYVQVVLIYGDTDSVMIHVPGHPTIDALTKLAQEACAMVNKRFVNLPPIKIDLEKFYIKGIWDKKKRYAGVKLLVGFQTDKTFVFNEIKQVYEPSPTNLFKEWKLDVKGSEKVRRDRIEFVRRTTARFQMDMLHQSNPAVRVVMLIKYAKAELTKLLRGEVSHFELIESQSTKLAYDSVKAQSVIAEKNEKRTGEKQQTGQRQAWITVHVPGETKNALMVEDPLYALENEIPVNYGLIMTNKVVKSWTSMLRHALTQDEIDDIFRLKETIRPQNHRISAKQGLGGFVLKIPHCRKCDQPLGNNRTQAPQQQGTTAPEHLMDENDNNSQVVIHTRSEKLLCSEHLKDYDEIRQIQNEKVAKLKAVYTPILSACQQCIGPFGDPNDCRRKDCRRLYDRIPARNAYFRAREEFVKDFGLPSEEGSLDW